MSGCLTHCTQSIKHTGSQGENFTNSWWTLIGNVKELLRHKRQSINRGGTARHFDFPSRNVIVAFQRSVIERNLLDYSHRLFTRDLRMHLIKTHPERHTNKCTPARVHIDVIVATDTEDMLLLFWTANTSSLIMCKMSHWACVGCKHFGFSVCHHDDVHHSLSFKTQT